MQCERIPTCRGDQLHIFFEQWSDFSGFFWKKLEIGSNSKNSDGLINTFFYKGNALFCHSLLLSSVLHVCEFFIGKILTSELIAKKKNFCSSLIFLTKKNFLKFHFGKFRKKFKWETSEKIFFL